MRLLRSFHHIPAISKAFRPFHFLFPSQILTICPNLAQSLFSKAPSVTSIMPAKGSTQQSETDKVLHLENLSIASDKNQKRRDYTARRERRRQGRLGQHADLARPDEIIQAEGQPSLNNIPTSRIRRVLASSKVQKISTQTALNPSFLSKTVISPMDHPQGTTPPATSVGSEPALLESNSASLHPSISSATPSSETQPAQHAQPGAPEHSPPVPHPIYFSLASSSPTRLTIPQRLLLVLDLNGTLLFREVGSTKYKPRPFLANFLKYCMENHVILIWSSAKPYNVDAVCKQLFTPEQQQKLLGIWARDTLGLTQAQYNSKTQVYKNLDHIWTNPAYAFRHPWFHQQGYMWSQKNTLLVDDSILKASAQPYNHIEIPEFLKDSKEAKAQKGTEVLGQVTAYLEEARMWDNVSAFVRLKRFRVDRGWTWDLGKGKGEEKATRHSSSAERVMSKGDTKREETVQLGDDEDEEQEIEGGGGVKLPRN